MSEDSQRLRGGIRLGEIKCRCVGLPAGQHTWDCSWWNAISEIYSIERAEDAVKEKAPVKGP